MCLWNVSKTVKEILCLCWNHSLFGFFVLPWIMQIGNCLFMVDVYLSRMIFLFEEYPVLLLSYKRFLRTDILTVDRIDITSEVCFFHIILFWGMLIIRGCLIWHFDETFCVTAWKRVTNRTSGVYHYTFYTLSIVITVICIIVIAQS